MMDIAYAMRLSFPGDTVLLIHDHGNWDANALAAYNLLIDDLSCNPRRLFEGLLSKTGKQAVGLQAADMIAYEVFKGVSGKVKSPEAAMRGAIREMINKQIPLQARWIDLESARAIYRVMKESGKYPDLESQGVC